MINFHLQAIRVIISDWNQVFRAISVGFKTVGGFEILRSHKQHISCQSTVRGQIFPQIVVRDPSGRSFQIVINDIPTTRRDFLEIVIRNTSRGTSLRLKIIASFIVSNKTL